MGLTAITQADDGSSVIPATKADWQEWVSAQNTRNFLLNDPLLDWLELYGVDNKFQRDSDLAGYDCRTDFSKFIFRKGQEFEEAVLACLRKNVSVATIGLNLEDARNLRKAEETFAAMKQGQPAIYKGVLWNGNSLTYGVPDLLIRSDQLARLFPKLLKDEEATKPAKDFGGVPWHYRVVDIKYTTLHLLAGGELGNRESAPAYKGQLFIYNEALGRIQGYLPPVSYLLGRTWEQTIKNETSRGEGCMERLAPVSQDSTLKGMSLATLVEQAIEWVRRVRRDGMNWSLLSDPSVRELRPNMKNRDDAPWSNAKHRIAEQLEDLTLLWQVGVDKRERANNLGIYRWRDQKCTALSIGVSGPKTQPVLQAVLDINQAVPGPVLAPRRIKAAEHEWRNEPILEFYVDFETVNSLADDFTNMPKRGGLPMIFMIGCGHMENKVWQFKCFTVDTLILASEADLIDAWIAHMKNVRNRLTSTDFDPLVIHWSPAETSNLSDAYNAAVQRHPDRSKNWSTPHWFDFLNRVINAQPVVVRGALAFGLKAIAQAMRCHGLIDTKWEDGPVDGLGAMVGVWWCAEEAARLNARLRDVDLMQTIERYNEVDCKVMMEIVRYLRQNH